MFVYVTYFVFVKKLFELDFGNHLHFSQEGVYFEFTSTRRMSTFTSLGTSVNTVNETFALVLCELQ